LKRFGRFLGWPPCWRQSSV